MHRNVESSSDSSSKGEVGGSNEEINGNSNVEDGGIARKKNDDRSSEKNDESSREENDDKASELIIDTSNESDEGESLNESMASLQRQEVQPLLNIQPSRNTEISPRVSNGRHKETPGKKLIHESSIELVPIVSASDVPHEDENVEALLKSFKGSQNDVLEVLHETLMRHDITADDIRDQDGNTLLHLAAARNFINIAETLLEHDIDMLVENSAGQLALEVALDGWRRDFDGMASLIIQKLPNESVRGLFSKTSSQPPRVALHDLVKEKFEKAVAAILNSMVDVTDEGETEVHYDILEADKEGDPPTETYKTCNNIKYSAYHIIALQCSIDIVNHDMIRLLTSKKWNTFARRRFIFQALLYLMTVFSLTFVAVTSSTCYDVMTYDTPLQYGRAVFEVVAYISICSKFLSEIRQLVRERKRYFSDFVNIIELLASAVLICVLPVRLLHTGSHWYVFAVGYILWIYIIHKYAAIFRSTGILAEILWQILTQDVVQFGILFAVVNVAFSGCFLLVLKGDDGLGVNSETSSFLAILLFGLRTLIEGESIVDYTVEYRTMSIIIIMLFLFVTIVILLNILIAHLSDTYHRVAAYADRNYEVSVARIIAWMEINDWSCSGCKTVQSKFYTKSEVIIDIKERLEIRKTSLMEEIGGIANLLVRKQNAHDLRIMTVKSEVKRMQGAVSVMKTEQPGIKRTLDEVTSELDGIRGAVNELTKFPTMMKECLNDLTSELREVKSSMERIVSEMEKMSTVYGAACTTGRRTLYDDIREGMSAPILPTVPPHYLWSSRFPTTLAQEADIECARQLMLFENIPDLQCTRDETDMFLSVDEWLSHLEDGPQHEVLAYLNDHYRRGERVGDKEFCNGERALHIAARRGHYFVVEKLIDVKVDLFAVNDDGKLALQIALDRKKDEVAALLIRRIDKNDARSLFLATSNNEEPVIRLVDYFNDQFPSFVLAVLDTLIDQDTVYYDVLEADRCGLTPDQAKHDRETDTVFQSLAKWADKNAINHIVVRVLILRKWYGYARRQFVFHLMLYLASLLSLTVATVKAAHADDVTRYTTSRDTERAVFEVLTLVFVSIGFLLEISELHRNKLQHFRDAYNWLEDGAALILLVMVPVARFTNVTVHWYIFAVGYFLWTIIIFKYAAIYRQSGAYAQILWHIIRRDIVQFSALFGVVNLAFSGSFLLVVRGDGALDVNNETSSLLGIFFVGLRTMTEGEPVLTYTGQDGYRTMGVIVMLVFLFATIVVLLNILIAQLSDTYTKIQGDAYRELEVRMANIIARIEQNPILPCCRNSGRLSSFVPNKPTKNIRNTAGVGPSILEDIFKHMEFVATKQVTNQLNALALKDETVKCKAAVKDLQASTDKQKNETTMVKNKVHGLGNDVALLQSDIKYTQQRVQNDMSSVASTFQAVMGQLSQVKDCLGNTRSERYEYTHTAHVEKEVTDEI